MLEELAPSQGVKKPTHLAPTQDRLLIVITNNNRNARELLRQWESDKPKTRNLSEFNPVRLNTGALLLDDVEYTRDCCRWLNTLYPYDVFVTEVNSIFTNDDAL